jgi:anaerobic magnesium-protoporphyrin IX monomethyl ester cyclase
VDEMKKIALIFVKNKEKSGQGASVSKPVLPHPLLHLGSYLKRKGIKVYLIDGQICDEKNEIDRIINEVDIIGFSVMTMQVAMAIELSDYIKKNYPEKKIIWGGVHPSLLPKQTLEDPSIDYICQREGEKTIYELAIEKPLKTIKNLGYKENGQIILNKVREDFLDLDKEDKPEWELLNLENYVGNYMIGGRNGGRSMAITVGRGCVFNCTFCVNTVMGRKWRKLSAKIIIKRIKELKEKYKITHFNINDDCFDTDWERVEEICKGLIKENLGITWDVSVRAGKKWTDERMELLSKSGCIAVSIGAESGSNRILKKIKKGISTEDIIYMAEQCNKHNISLISSWMSGFPTETEEEVKETINLLKKVTKICPSCSIHGPQPLKPYPGSELYFEAIEGGFKEPQNLREWAKKSSDGFISHEYLPWIKNPKKLMLIEFYCMNANRFPRNFLHKFLVYSSRLRLDHNFYFFPFEVPLTKWYVTNIINNEKINK